MSCYLCCGSVYLNVNCLCHSFTFKDQSIFGINSTKKNVYSKGRLIGYCDKDYYHFKPVDGWKNRFSINLMKQLKLI
jgi:hypothetical protein